jgi:hypothetical protein
MMANVNTPRRRGGVEACAEDIPKTIKIGAYDWTVCVKTEPGDKYGQADFEYNHINVWMRNLTSSGHAVGIVLHECLHVIFDNHGLGRLKRGKEEREEQIVLGFEAGLVSLLRDNPKLLAWMKRWLSHA